MEMHVLQWPPVCLSPSCITYNQPYFNCTSIYSLPPRSLEANPQLCHSIHKYFSVSLKIRTLFVINKIQNNDSPQTLLTWDNLENIIVRK